MANRIKFGAVREEHLPQRSLPVGLLRGLHVDRNSFIVLLDRGAQRRIYSHARRHVDQRDPRRTVECAGLLAGQAYVDPQRQVTFVAISQAVETAAESQSPGSVRIAPQDFQRSRQQIDAMRLRVVGWYHTHPDYGIFLSQDDRIVVQTLFNASYHVALVYDPIRGQIGSFYGPNSVRVDPDSDRDEDIKQNYIVVDDWGDFWGDDSSNETGGSGENERTHAPSPLHNSQIVPGAAEDAPPDNLNVPVDPLSMEEAASDDALEATYPVQTSPSRRARLTQEEERRSRPRSRHARQGSRLALIGLLGIGAALLVMLGIAIGRWFPARPDRPAVQPVALAPTATGPQPALSAQNTALPERTAPASPTAQITSPAADTSVQLTPTVPATSASPQTAQQQPQSVLSSSAVAETPSTPPADALVAQMGNPGECKAADISSSPKQASGHVITATVLDLQGMKRPGIVIDIWADEKIYPSMKRGQYSCTTDVTGTCNMQPITLEVLETYIGVRESDCELPFNKLPSEPQNFNITLVYTEQQ